jgi:exonuclease III
VSGEDELKKRFQLNMYDGYECFFNSSCNKRGTGILINKKFSCLVQDRYCDREENFILLRLSIQGEQIILGSIYGPNNVDENFFPNLRRGIASLKENVTGNPRIILGGDWNCTICNELPDFNIDILNMKNLPNRQHTELLGELMLDIGLSEPYRLLHQEKVEFTYVPRSDAMNNKSRIDFFLISDDLCANVSECYISDTLQNKLFDHKAIFLTLNKKKIAIKRDNALLTKY